MELLSTPVSGELYSLYGSELDLAGPKEELKASMGGSSEPASCHYSWRSFQADGLTDRCRGAQAGLARPSSFSCLHQLFLTTRGPARQQEALLDARQQIHRGNSYWEKTAYLRPLTGFPSAALWALAMPAADSPASSSCSPTNASELVSDFPLILQLPLQTFTSPAPPTIMGGLLPKI